MVNINTQSSRVSRTVDRSKPEKFEIGRLISHLANRHQKSSEDQALFEIKTLKEKAGSNRLPENGGIVLPFSLLNETFAVITTTTAADAIGKAVVYDSALAWLVDQAPILNMVTRLEDLSADISIPGATTGATVGWGAEGVVQTESTPVIAGTLMSPKTLSGAIQLSKKSIIQTGGWMAAYLRETLGNQLAEGVTSGVLSGTGMNNQPRGILNTTDINTVVYTDANLAFSTFTSARAKVAGAKIPVRAGAYIIEDALYGLLEATDRATGAGRFIVSEGTPVEAVPQGYIGKHPAIETTLLDAETAIFGSWNECFVGFWDGMELVVDGITAPANVKITGLMYVDVAVPRPKAFTKISK